MPESLKDRFRSLQRSLPLLPVTDALQTLYAEFGSGVVFSTSFGYEDQVITHLISQSAPVVLFTLDTGRLFPETYSTWSRTLERYGLPITAYYPDDDAIKNFVTANGPNAFYQSLDLRQTCCGIRKVQPLKKALAGKAVWVTGLRVQHSANRSGLQTLEWDEANDIIKYNPLLHWTTDEVKAFIDKHNIPYNALHDRGFISIGCAPCTRAVKPGEDFRAGRWWWEEPDKKECGLHAHQTLKPLHEQTA